jgi:hypothetical protein
MQADCTQVAPPVDNMAPAITGLRRGQCILTVAARLFAFLTEAAARDLWLHGLYVRTLNSATSGVDWEEATLVPYDTGAPNVILWSPASAASRLWVTSVALLGPSYWGCLCTTRRLWRVRPRVSTPLHIRPMCKRVRRAYHVYTTMCTATAQPVGSARALAKLQLPRVAVNSLTNVLSCLRAGPGHHLFAMYASLAMYATLQATPLRRPPMSQKLAYHWSGMRNNCFPLIWTA